MDTLIEGQAEFLKALAHPTRLRLLYQLVEGERCVCDLMTGTTIEQVSVSQHLAILRNQGIVETRREGTRIIYRLKRHEAEKVLALAAVAVTARIEEGNAMLQRLQARDAIGGTVS